MSWFRGDSIPNAAVLMVAEHIDGIGAPTPVLPMHMAGEP